MILIILNIIGLVFSTYYTVKYVERGCPGWAAFFSSCMAMNGYCLVVNLLA